MNEQLKKQYDDVKNRIEELYSQDDGYTWEEGYDVLSNVTDSLIDIVDQLIGE